MEEREKLLEALLDGLGADSRVEALWLDGSLGRGVADEVSDIDLGVAVGDEELEGFLESVPGILRGLCDPVMLQVFGRLFVVVTPEWQRVDLFVRTSADVTDGVSGPIRVVRDPKVLLKQNVDSPTPLSQRLEPLVQEFLRFLGLLPVVAHRGEWTSAYLATGQMAGMLVELMQLASGTHRRIGGALRLRDRLSEDDQEQLRGLPPLTPDEESILAVHGALARLFLPRAQALAAERGLDYPVRMDEALRRHLGNSGLAIDIG